jgi:phage terminase large subunit
VEVQSEIIYGDVFDQTLNAYEQGKKVIIHKGGTGSGKTEDIIIFLCFIIAVKQKNKIITIVSESRPHLDIGTIRILKKYLTKTELYNSVKYNETTGRCLFSTGSIIEFFSADRIGKALGARRHWLFGNEINSLKEDIWDELARRSEYVIADFNPTIQFWLEDWIQNYNDTIIIKSNYLSNPNLPEFEIERIKKRAERDANFKRIHIDCEYGGLEGLIYPNWKYGEFDNSLPFAFGLDFGFHPDPDAMIKVAINRKTKQIFLHECFYNTNQLVSDLRLNVSRHAKQHELIIADSASPRMITELRNQFNVKPVKKFSGSKIEGIRIMQDFELIVTKESTNLVKELRNYIWNDKRAGIPIDAFDHLLDAAQYVIRTLSIDKGRQVWRTSNV